MPETLTTSTLPETLHSAEPLQTKPDYLCKAFNLYVAAQSILMSKHAGISRQDFSPDHLAKLDFGELMRLKGETDAYWASPAAATLRDSLSNKSHIANQDLSSLDGQTRQEIIELAQAGVAGSMVKHIKNKADLLLERTAQAPPHNGPIKARLYDIKRGLIEEKRHATSDAIGFNHHARALAESPWSKEHNLGRQQLFQLIASALQGDRSEARKIEAGLALEIALHRTLQTIAEKRRQRDEVVRLVRYGDGQEDARGGDIVLIIGHTKFYIDSKNSEPNPDHTDPQAGEAGFELTQAGAEKNGYNYKVTIWANNSQVVGEHFEILDQHLSSSLVQLMDEADQRAGLSF